MRELGLDAHRDFCEVAIWQAGELRSAGRVETTPEALELFAQSLARSAIARRLSGPAVVDEVTGSAQQRGRAMRTSVSTDFRTGRSGVERVD